MNAQRSALEEDWVGRGVWRTRGKNGRRKRERYAAGPSLMFEKERKPEEQVDGLLQKDLLRRENGLLRKAAPIAIC
jgi:hypothetical protein